MLAGAWAGQRAEFAEQKAIDLCSPLLGRVLLIYARFPNPRQRLPHRHINAPSAAQVNAAGGSVDSASLMMLSIFG